MAAVGVAAAVAAAAIIVDATEAVVERLRRPIEVRRDATTIDVLDMTIGAAEAVTTTGAEVAATTIDVAATTIDAAAAAAATTIDAAAAAAAAAAATTIDAAVVGTIGAVTAIITALAPRPLVGGPSTATIPESERERKSYPPATYLPTYLPTSSACLSTS